MRNIGVFNSFDKGFNKENRAVKYLNKLLIAADTAQKQGKYLALDKVLKEAKKLSEKIRESESNPFSSLSSGNHKKALSELQWLRYQGVRKVPPQQEHSYKKVSGVIVE